MKNSWKVYEGGMSIASGEPPPDDPDDFLSSSIRAYGDDVILEDNDLTEDGIALRFVQMHGAELRYDHKRSCWYRWTGKAWRPDETKLAFSWVRRVCRDISVEVEAKKALKAVLGRANTASAVERFAQSDPGVSVTSTIWDNNPLVMGTPGGTINLQSGCLVEANPEDFITRLTSVAPASTPECPLWIQFLEEATRHDQALIRFLRQWCGYTLTGRTAEHALLFIYGPGGNGKSVFLNTVAGILGEYCTIAAMESFTASGSDRHPTDMAMLKGARMVYASETEEGRAWAESRIKAVTGGDPITARFMRQDFFTYTPEFKLVVIGNHMPILKNVDDAARRRFNVVPFVFKPATADHELEHKLRQEWPAILRWMIDGCIDWQKNGLVRPVSVQSATASYFDEQDLAQQWVQENCKAGPRQYDTMAVLFKSWSDFAAANGEKPGSAKWFAQTLVKLGFEQTKHTPGHNGKRGFLGISVKPEDVSQQYQNREEEW